MCLNCLENNISNKIYFRYKEFLVKSINEINLKYEDIIQFKEFYFKKFPITIKDKSINLNDVQVLIGKNIENFLDKFKNELCICCQTHHKDNENQSIFDPVKLNCGCKLLSEGCTIHFYLNLLKNREKNNEFYCYCSYKFNLKEIKSLLTTIQSNNQLDNKLRLALKQKCNLCFKNNEDNDSKSKEKAYQLVADKKDEKVHDYLICEECYHKMKDGKSIAFNCVVCFENHNFKMILKNKIH